jgi:hypothetical protein
MPGYVWVLVPALVIVAIVVGIAGTIFIELAFRPPSWVGHAVLWMLLATAILGPLGWLDRRRFRWAWRCVAGMILVTCVGYFVAELVEWRNGKPLGAPIQPGSSMWSAVGALLFFGVPALRFAVTGRSAADDDAISAPATYARPRDTTGPPQFDEVVRPGIRYRVIKAFTDHDRKLHPVGEEWTFLRHAFLPYEDGMTFFISVDGNEESRIHLQWRTEEQSHILDNLAEYVVALDVQS